MTRRLPGKKIRDEHFSVDGAAVLVEIRLADDGKFFCRPDAQTHFEAPSLAELRAQVRPYLESTRRLTFDPVIDVSYLEQSETSYFDNMRDHDHHQEIRLGFQAGWLSREEVHGYRRWVQVSVDEDTCEIEELTARAREKSFGGRFSKQDHVLPFTPGRWQRLCAIAGALASVRGRIAEVLQDATGAKLDAAVLPKLLGEAPKKMKR